MAAVYLTSADIDALVGTDVRTALFVDDTGNTHLARCIQLASAVIKSAAHRAGYTGLGDTTTDEQVIAATLGQFLVLMYNRKQQRVPPEFFEVVNMATEIREGRLPLLGLTASTTSAAAGGAAFSETNSSVSGARYNPLSRERLDVY